MAECKTREFTHHSRAITDRVFPDVANEKRKGMDIVPSYTLGKVSNGESTQNFSHFWVILSTFA